MRARRWTLPVAVLLLLQAWIASAAVPGADASLLLSGMLGLFSRIREDEVLASARRLQIRDFVREHPGRGLKEIARDLGIGWGTAVHHLNRLEDAGVLRSRTAGRLRAFYVASAAPTAHAGFAVPAAVQHRLLSFVVQNPGTSQNQAAATAGISGSLAHRYLRRLEAEGVVRSRREWRRRLYEPTEATRARLDRLAERRNALGTPGPERPSSAVSLAGTTRV